MRNMGLKKRVFLAVATAVVLTGLPWVAGKRQSWFRSEPRRYRDAVWTTYRKIKPEAAAQSPPLHTIRLFGRLVSRLPRGWSVKARNDRGGQACTMIKIPSGHGHASGRITLQPLVGKIGDLRGQYFGRNEYGPSVRAYYGSISAFLAPYPTPLSLWLAIFRARPADVRWSWGRARWRIDTLLMLKPGLMGGWETDLLQARHVTTFIRSVGQSGGDRGASGNGTPARYGWRCVAALFDHRGKLRYAAVNIRVMGLRKPAALGALMTVLWNASFSPGRGTHGDGHGR